MRTPARHPTTVSSPRTLLAIGLLAIASLVVACASAAAPGSTGGRDNEGGVPAASPGSGDEFGGLTDRKIIRTGDISIEVPNIAAALARVRTMAVQLGGYVGGSQSGTLDESATLTLRIPADRFEDALARLHELDGTVLNETTREEDVTSAVVDLEARIQNLQASEAQYRTVLAQAVKIEDILAVQTRLDDVRGQIEQLQAQHKELSGLASLATLTVTLVPGAVQQAAGHWDPGKTVTDAFAALVGFGQNLGNAAIWFVIVVLPALVGLVLLLWLVRRLVPGLRTPRTPKE